MGLMVIDWVTARDALKSEIAAQKQYRDIARKTLDRIERAGREYDTMLSEHLVSDATWTSVIEPALREDDLRRRIKKGTVAWQIGGDFDPEFDPDDEDLQAVVTTLAEKVPDCPFPDIAAAFMTLKVKLVVNDTVHDLVPCDELPNGFEVLSTAGCKRPGIELARVLAIHNEVSAAAYDAMKLANSLNAA